MNILLVEDNKEIVSALKISLEENNYNVISFDRIKEATNYLDKNMPDLIILDVTLPDGNGFDLYSNLIKNKKIPVIFLTALDSEESIVKGLELGADDYMTKPFLMKELLVRIKKILLRNKKDSVIKVKNITFDIDKLILKKDGKEISLTALELNLLQVLFINKGSIVTRDSLCDKIWYLTGNDVDDHTITVYMKRIKDKINTDIITTVKGIGYKINDEE